MKRHFLFIITAFFILMASFSIYSYNQRDEIVKEQEQIDNEAPQRTEVKSENQSQQRKIGLLPGYYAPDFTLEDVKGQTQSLSDYRGKYLLLNFWAIWCPPCKAEMPDLDQFHMENSDQIAVLGVELGSKASEVRQFVSKGQYQYPILLDTKNKIGKVYRISAVPTTYIINPEGKILHMLRGAVNKETLQLIKDTLLAEEK